MKASIATLATLLLVALFATASSASDPYWQFTGKWLCISTNGSTVGYDFSEVADSTWLSQATQYNNGEDHQWVQNYVKQDPDTGNWVALNFQAGGTTFQGRSSGFDKTGTLTFTGFQQGFTGGDYREREVYSFQKGDDKMAHDWQTLTKDGWKTTSTTSCSRTH